MDWPKLAGQKWIGQSRPLPPLVPLCSTSSTDIAAVRRVAPGVQLFSSSARCPGQLCAGDLELMAESQHDLQVALDAAASWARKWRFTFGIGPTKSAATVWPPTSCSFVFRHSCRCTFTGGFRVSPSGRHPDSPPYLGRLMLNTLCHVATASSPSASPGASLSLPVRFASTLFTSCVLLSISWRSEFRLFPSCPSLAQLCVATLGEVGRLVLPSHLSSWSLVGQMLSTSH